MLKSCYNPKVIAALAAVGIGIFIFAPGVALAALPVLLVLACPLSMLLMPVLMGKQMAGSRVQAAGAGDIYTCPMHPQATSPVPSQCPVCGMNLVPADPRSEVASSETNNQILSQQEQVAQLEMRLQLVQEEQATIAKQLAELNETRGRKIAAGVVQAATADTKGNQL